MSFQELQARFSRQYQENKSWKLLRAQNAPLILAFVGDLFSENSDVSFSKARVALDAELLQSRELGIWETDKNAIAYLREWILAGWLRELDDNLSLTDACEIALRFSQSLDQRENSATATHLRIVQEAVRDFALAISPNIQQRISSLKDRQAELQSNIDDLEAGVIPILSDIEQRERVKEIYQLASVLTGDFRRVEDEIREMDQKLRIEIIESDRSRGEILLGVLEKEQLLANTDAGRAFEGFFQLLCDQNRSLEFREQLRGLLNQSVSKHLTKQQKRFLTQLMRELSKESERVFTVRRRTEESLRAYIESGAHLETQAVDELLSKLERFAVAFRDADVDPRREMGIDVSSGSIKIASPETIKLKVPEADIDMSEVQVHANSNQPSQTMLESLDAVKVAEVAMNIKSVLVSQGPMTLGQISQYNPIRAGLEELVACLRIARAIGAVELGTTEKLSIEDKTGRCFNATIPSYLLNANQFPDNIEEMTL